MVDAERKYFNMFRIVEIEESTRNRRKCLLGSGIYIFLDNSGWFLNSEKATKCLFIPLLPTHCKS